MGRWAQQSRRGGWTVPPPPGPGPGLLVLSVSQFGTTDAIWFFNGPVTVTNPLGGAGLTYDGTEEPLSISNDTATSIEAIYDTNTLVGAPWDLTAQPTGVAEQLGVPQTGLLV